MSRLIVYVVVYLIYRIPLFVIAKKSEHPLAWLAFVPFADVWLMCDMADMELWWLLVVILLPGLGFFIFTLVAWMAIAENTNKPAWLGILMVFPLINLPAGYYMAFVDTGGLVA